MKLRVVVLALILGVASIQPVNAIENPRDLLKFCQKLEQGRKGAGEDIRIPNTRESLLCWGYMQAIQDLSVLVDEDRGRMLGSCPPEQTTSLQLIHSFVVYAKSHPDALEGNTAATVIKALQQAFPCR